MKVLMLTIISALIWTNSCLAGNLQKNISIQCDNGVKATGDF